MKIIWSLVLIGLFAITVTAAKKTRKFEGDFEFADEDEGDLLSERKTEKKWIYDPESDLCRPLNCKKKEICLLEDAFTAVCVSKKEIHKNGDLVVPAVKTISDEDETLDDDVEDDVFYDSDDETDDQPDTNKCEACPVVKPEFLCGSDNHTYSSLCRLDYHNCLHSTSVRVTCKGFCPCKDQSRRNRMHTYRKKKVLLDRDEDASPSSERQGRQRSQYREAEETLPLERQDRKHSQYRYTPGDFKYDNKHYKYIKYTKYNDEINQKKNRENLFNDVLDTNSNRYKKIQENDIPESDRSGADVECSMENMANRLLDWFSVLMQDNGETNSDYEHTKGFPASCKPEVRWMFGHLDKEGDGSLSLQDLYALEHDEQERCLRPFVSACDRDSDRRVSRAEWCRCLHNADRPCVALTRKATRNHYQGAYVPQCDSAGYYRALQCHPAVGVCWCVDRHGVEQPNSRTKGQPHCPEDSSLDTNLITDDDEDSAGESSGDQPLDF